MAQVVIEMGVAPAASIHGEGQLLSIHGLQGEEITSTGTSQSTTITTTNAGDAVVITNNGAEDIWVAFGSSPTAAVGTTAFIPANTLRDFGDMRTGYKVAVINDS